MPTEPDVRLTFGDVCDQYLERHVRRPTRRPRGTRMMEVLIALARRAEIPAAHGTTVKLEEKPIDAITKADIEAVRAWRRAELAAGRSRPGAKGGETGINRLLSRVRHLFNWAIGEGFLLDTPFKRGPVTVVKIDRSIEYARTRRLDAAGEEHNEEQRLLDHADAYLRAVLVAALSTGCRIGEVLSLQWSQIRHDEKNEARWLLLPATKTKSGEMRMIPIGDRLRAELSMRRHASTARSIRRHAYVFGDKRARRSRVFAASGKTRSWGRTVTRRSDPRQADAGITRGLSSGGSPCARSAARVCEPTARIVGRSARRPDVPRARRHHDDEQVSAEHASPPRARLGETRRNLFAHDSHKVTSEADQAASKRDPRKSS